MDFTVTGLYASIRRRASIPTTSTTGQANSDLLAYLNEELRLRLMADILKVRSGFFLRNADTTLTSATAYRIPPRAIGGKLSLVSLLSNGVVYGPPIPEIPETRIGEFSGLSQLAAYYVQNQSIVLVPNSSSSATTLRLGYYQRPGELVASGYATITVINTSTNVLTTGSSHGYTTSSTLDFVKATPGFENPAIDQTPTAASGSSLTFSSLPSTLAVGDYVTVAGQSPVPQVPEEFHVILAQRVALKLLQAGGWKEEAQEAQMELAQMEAAAGVLVSPRVDGGGQKFVNTSSALGALWRGA